MNSGALSLSGPRQDLDPTEKLREALARFESILTGDQKRKYQTSNAKPDAGSVLRFVDELDNTNNTMKQCVGPRLSTFLGRVQQFTSIVDTFVSANPEIAALVWGGVRVAILAVSNITSYFDKITSLIMEIGKSCPAYQQFGQLYPGCVKLQRALCGYYAIIVALCIKIIEVSRRPLLQQTFSAIIKPFEADFKDFLNDLAKAVRDIEQQISLASKQDAKETKNLLAIESSKNAWARKSAAIFQRDSKKEYAEAHEWRVSKRIRDAERLRIRIRNNLSTIDYMKSCNRAQRQRVKGTAEWLLKEPSFLEWQTHEDTAILWCPGTMGAGKTILMSHVVTHLHKQTPTNEIVAYYFCRADDTASLSARNILGSLARQILDLQIVNALNDTLYDLYDDSKDLDTPELTDFIIDHLQLDTKYYLVIDGLDECEIFEVRKVARSVAQLCSTRAKDFKVLFSGRPELERSLFGAIGPKYRIAVTETKIGSEMDRYIAATLERCLDEEELVLGDQMLKSTIEEALQKGSNGMFLWTRLFIEELCAQGSDNEILEALKHPPRALSEIFDRKLSRVRKKTARNDAFSVLQYCGVMRRPLTTMEYQEALSLSPGQQSLDRGKFPNDMNKVISHCCGLTYVDEEDNTVHYVHHSVKQHLFAMDRQDTEDFNTERLERHIGVLCMTYLDFTDLKSQLKLFEHTANTPIQPVRFGILPLSSSKGITGRIAQKLLLHHPQLQHLRAGELERKAKKVIGEEDSSLLDAELQRRDFHFLEYARTYWINHLADLQPDPHDTTWSLFCRCLEGDDIVAYKPWDSVEETHEDEDEDDVLLEDENDVPPAIKWLSAHGHYSLLLYHVRHHSSLLTKEVEHHIFRSSAIHGHHHLNMYIFQHTSNPSELVDFGLHCAYLDGAGELLDDLIKFVTDVNPRVFQRAGLEQFLRGVLAVAAKGGHVEVVRRILAENVDINARRSAVTDGRTALELAAKGGHVEVVDLLLAANSHVNGVSGFSDRRTALQAAASEGHLNIVERLLAAKASVDGVHSIGSSPLEAAAARGHLDVVERLLAANADADGPGHEFSSPLYAAAAGGHLNVVERLLAANADVDGPGYGSSTPLHAAADKNRLEILERLLAANADVNKMPLAIVAAASRGHLEIVKRLIAANADLGFVSDNWDTRTPLQAAEKGGHRAVIKLLKEAGAEQ
ncbi:unnamed protein product [Penicillium salamii]|uniref:NACHT domain-containing protein n=1 Tax=Penicillium salamii TaxID=1612424 RepID=A0A9W4NN57_9EURO|nr:unnamed protein product [Penicillium salamii]